MARTKQTERVSYHPRDMQQSQVDNAEGRGDEGAGANPVCPPLGHDLIHCRCVFFGPSPETLVDTAEGRGDEDAGANPVCPPLSHDMIHCRCISFGPPTEAQFEQMNSVARQSTAEGSIFDNLAEFENIGNVDVCARRTPFPGQEGSGHAQDKGKGVAEQGQDELQTPTTLKKPRTKRRKPTPAEIRQLKKQARFEDVDSDEQQRVEIERKMKEDADFRYAEQQQARERQAKAAADASADIDGEEARRRNAERRQKYRNDRQPWQNQPPPPPPPTTKRKYKFRPGTVALREIRKYQKSTDPIIPRAPFARVVKELLDECSDSVTRVQARALGALQHATEDLAVSLFQDSVLCMAHAKRVTIKPVDMSLALRIRQDDCIQKQ